MADTDFRIRPFLWKKEKADMKISAFGYQGGVSFLLHGTP